MSVLYWLQSLFPKHIFNQQLLIYANKDTSGVDIGDDEQLEEPFEEPLVDDYESIHLMFFNEKAHISVQSEELKAENKLHKFSTTNSNVESCQSGEITLVFEPKHRIITANSQPVKAKTKNIKADQEETPSTIKIKEADIQIIRASSNESTQGGNIENSNQLYEPLYNFMSRSNYFYKIVPYIKE
ncbi:uncharacterized protein KQ657_002330 [Scheffersomyces spartinae]|uniref:Uncharacterized protein n=1 Tax=Scheffersomyces spartinae TaxID=45513 RepID=A0A9P7VDN9_9ASCO|nr:uncharacterized protein KQ657_002330 [Scheffersomyces spartinae]KAG7195944.1 hypothetical protein KQ657_002330 [Scheffersomyces spartinae]